MPPRRSPRSNRAAKWPSWSAEAVFTCAHCDSRFLRARKPTSGLRERFREIHAKRGAAHLHKMLRRVDPVAAEKLFPNDYVRVIRALEVYFQTGDPDLPAGSRTDGAARFAHRIVVFALNPPRGELYELIDRRTEEHFARGLVDESETFARWRRKRRHQRTRISRLSQGLRVFARRTNTGKRHRTKQARRAPLRQKTDDLVSARRRRDMARRIRRQR